MIIDVLSRIYFNIMLVVSIYVIEKRQIKILDRNFVFSVIVLNLLSFIVTSLDLVEIKPFLNVIILLFVDFLFLKNKFSKSLFKIALIYGILLMCELALILGLSLLGNFYDSVNFENIIDLLNTNIIFSAISNIVVSSILVLSLFINYVRDIYTNIIKIFKKIKIRKYTYWILLLILFFTLVYQSIVFSDNVIFNVCMLMILLVVIIIFYSKDLNVRFDYEETKEKYSSVQNSLLKYEDMIDKYRVTNHENKNQLLIIQNMIKHNDSKVNEYIENLVGNVYMTNEKIMMDVSIIPAGGLRATIHTKLNKMDDKKIKYSLNIDRKLRTIDFDDLSSDLNLKICNIVSIFIDNSIDEVSEHKNKKIINIEMYLDSNILTIEVSNKYKNDLNIDKIFDKGYTTKSEGHGYGLALAKELVESEECLTNFQRIEDNIFTQVLEIKIKK